MNLHKLYYMFNSWSFVVIRVEQDKHIITANDHELSINYITCSIHGNSWQVVLNKTNI